VACIDTNVLVRLIVKDDVVQWALAQARIAKVLEDGETILLLRTVLLESEWVLRALYKFDKDTILNTFEMLLEREDLFLEGERAVEYACNLYRTSSADFADCLHLATAWFAEELPFLTFDMKVSRLPDGELVV